MNSIRIIKDVIIYRGVLVKNEDVSILFDSCNLILDWYNAIKYCLKTGIETEYKFDKKIFKIFGINVIYFKDIPYLSRLKDIVDEKEYSIYLFFLKCNLEKQKQHSQNKLVYDVFLN